MQGAVSVERQVTKSATVSATYLNSRGFDQFITINANAPYPGTPGSTVRPYPNRRQHLPLRLRRQFQAKPADPEHQRAHRPAKSSCSAFTRSDMPTATLPVFPASRSNSYDISQDWGRASFDVRHRLFLGGSIAFPYLFRLSPFMVVQSGAPFSIMSPIDENGDSRSSTIVPGYRPPLALLVRTRMAPFTARSLEHSMHPVPENSCRSILKPGQATSC